MVEETAGLRIDYDGPINVELDKAIKKCLKTFGYHLRASEQRFGPRVQHREFQKVRNAAR